MPFAPKLTPLQIAQIVDAYAKGEKRSVILERFNISRATLRYHLDRAGVEGRPVGRPEIENPVRPRSAANRTGSPRKRRKARPGPPVEVVEVVVTEAQYIKPTQVQLGSLGANWNTIEGKVIEAFGKCVPLEPEVAREQIAQQLKNQNGKCATHNCSLPLLPNQSWAIYNDAPRVMKIVCTACSLNTDFRMR